jgi:hypothetical protein
LNVPHSLTQLFIISNEERKKRKKGRTESILKRPKTRGNNILHEPLHLETTCMKEGWKKISTAITAFIPSELDFLIYGHLSDHKFVQP